MTWKRRLPKAIGYKGDEIELPHDIRIDYLKFGLSWKRAKRDLREDDERREQVRQQARAQRQALAPEPTTEDGVRQWASPALLRLLEKKKSEP